MGTVRTVHRGGSRFYVHPDTPEVKVPGVTSVIGMLPKPFLAPWNAKLVAELAVDSLPFVEQMAARDRQGAVDFLKGAARRYTKIRADIGSQAHDIFERMIRGEHVGLVHPDLEPYRANFEEFLTRVNPELVDAENVAWSDAHEYAGSFDAMLRVWVIQRLDGTTVLDPTRGPDSEPVLLMADWKTSKDVHAEVALQMAAYAHADRIIRPDGESVPMPKVDGAAVLHITPDGWSFRPVKIEREIFDFFLSLRHIFNWDREVSRTVVGRALAQAAGRLVTGTQRRAR